MIRLEDWKEPAVLDPTGRYRQPKERGPNGHPLCRWCHQEVPPTRRKWCGDCCVHPYLAQTRWDFLRMTIYRRDGKRCRKCNVLCGIMGQNPWSPPVTWEVDHLVARQDGGKNTPDNLRLLCTACHRANTAAQRRRGARERKARAASISRHRMFGRLAQVQ